MRSIFLLALFSVSTVALACPTLAGNYKCEQTEKDESTKHDISVSQNADTITIEDQEAGYTEGPIQLKALTKVSAYNADLLYRVTCTKDAIVIYGSDSDDSKETAVTIKMVKNAKGYSSTWTSKDETIKSKCEKI